MTTFNIQEIKNFLDSIGINPEKATEKAVLNANRALYKSWGHVNPTHIKYGNIGTVIPTDNDITKAYNSR